MTEQEYSSYSEKIEKKFQFMIDNNGNIPEEMRTKKFSQRLILKDGMKVVQTLQQHPYLMIMYITLNQEF